METNLARLAEAAMDRFGDYPSLLFDDVWHTSGLLARTGHPGGRRAARGRGSGG